MIYILGSQDAEEIKVYMKDDIHLNAWKPHAFPSVHGILKFYSLLRPHVPREMVRNKQISKFNPFVGVSVFITY